MTFRLVRRSVLAMACALPLTSCERGSPHASPASRAEIERQLNDSQELVRSYESRYGKLLPARPAHDFRKLRTQLKGKPASTVVALLGKPAKVFTSGTSESWDYLNAAYDSVSGRTVRRMEIWFRNGVVEYINTSF